MEDLTDREPVTPAVSDLVLKGLICHVTLRVLCKMGEVLEIPRRPWSVSRVPAGLRTAFSSFLLPGSLNHHLPALSPQEGWLEVEGAAQASGREAELVLRCCRWSPVLELEEFGVLVPLLSWLGSEP